jgi:hypothetical protein
MRTAHFKRYDTAEVEFDVVSLTVDRFQGDVTGKAISLVLMPSAIIVDGVSDLSKDAPLEEVVGSFSW